MSFFVLYYQTMEFTGVYQRWTTYALMPKCRKCIFVQTVKKLNFWEKAAVDESALIKACSNVMVVVLKDILL